MKTILITGGAGFIGSHVVRRFVTDYPEYKIVNLDKLTYAGNLANLREVESARNPTVIEFKHQRRTKSSAVFFLKTPRQFLSQW